MYPVSDEFAKAVQVSDVANPDVPRAQYPAQDVSAMPEVGQVCGNCGGPGHTGCGTSTFTPPNQ